MTFQFFDERLPERFWDKVIPEPMSGCWLWIASAGGLGDYGQFTLVAAARGTPQRVVRSHRFAFEALVGPIPGGLDLDHLCRVRRCCNPDHLEPVTRHENVARGNGGLHWAAKTHCPSGHPYDDDNTRLDDRPNGGKKRSCRACDLARYPRTRTPAQRRAYNRNRNLARKAKRTKVK